MTRTDYLAEFELVVMLGLARLDAEAYGMTIHDEIHRVTQRDVSIPAVYVTLNRLEKKGYVSSRVGDPTPSRGGRAKKYYQLTPEGVTALEKSEELLSKLWRGVSLQSIATKP